MIILLIVGETKVGNYVVFEKYWAGIIYSSYD